MGEDDVIDVITGLKAVAAGSQAAKSGGSLISNLLDPITKEMGEELRTWWVERRRNNIVRVAEAAERKLVEPQGPLSLKVFQAVLDGGSLAEDQLATEYFGGVLASSLSGVDRDDRGATFAKLVDQMSVYQLRTHYLIYSEIKRLYDGTVCSLGTPICRASLRLYISMKAYESALELAPGEDLTGIFIHSFHGLSRLKLMDDMYAVVGEVEDLRSDFPGVPDEGMLVQPSALGAELFTWSHGLGRKPYRSFLHRDVNLEGFFTLPIDGSILPAAKPANSEPEPDGQSSSENV